MDFEENIELSIIIPTINRRSELVELLLSIKKSINLGVYEIIIIDQNVKGFLDDILIEFKEVLRIRHFSVGFKGLSKAKNYGASLAKGKWLCFPDDDCELFSNTISVALNYAEEINADIVFGKCIDRLGNDSVMKFKNECTILTLSNMEGGFVEATGFVKKEIFKVFRFDENLGAGSFYGAEEGYDWLLRILRVNEHKIFFNPNVIFYHPQVILHKGDMNSLDRVFKYRCGTAYLCKKHKLYKKYFLRLSLSSFACLVFFFISKNKSKFYLVETCSLIVGWAMSTINRDE